MAASYILRLDDIAPNMNWAAFERIVQAAGEHGVQPLIGVIPDNRDPELIGYPACPTSFWEVMQGLQRQGWGIAMHGYQHLYETSDAGLLGRSPKSEFAGLPLDRQIDKVRTGKTIIEEAGLRIDCFMAPSHSFDDSTLQALASQGIHWLTDGFALYPFRWRGMGFVPQILASPRRMPFGVHTVSIHLNTISERKMERLLRFLADQRASFISFREATRHSSWRPGNRLLGRALRRLIVARRAR